MDKESLPKIYGVLGYPVKHSLSPLMHNKAFQALKINAKAVEDGIWKGFNTDIPGFSQALRENIDPANKRAAILGAGGAARAVAYVLAQSKVKAISIYD